MEWFWGRPIADGFYLLGGISAEKGVSDVWTPFVYRGDLVPAGWWCKVRDLPEKIEGGEPIEIPKTPVTVVNDSVEEMVQTVPEVVSNTRPPIVYHEAVIRIHTAVSGVPTGQAVVLSISARDAEEVLEHIHEKMDLVRTAANGKLQSWHGMELVHLLSGWYGQIVDRPE